MLRIRLLFISGYGNVENVFSIFLKFCDFFFRFFDISSSGYAEINDFNIQPGSLHCTGAKSLQVPINSLKEVYDLAPFHHLTASENLESLKV